MPMHCICNSKNNSTCISFGVSSKLSMKEKKTKNDKSLEARSKNASSDILRMFWLISVDSHFIIIPFSPLSSFEFLVGLTLGTGEWRSKVNICAVRRGKRQFSMWLWLLLTYFSSRFVRFHDTLFTRYKKIEFRWLHKWMDVVLW